MQNHAAARVNGGVVLNQIRLIGVKIQNPSRWFVDLLYTCWQRSGGYSYIRL